MSKKIIGLLLVLCMVVGLLPVVALADATDGKATIRLGFSNYSTPGFDKPIYLKSVAKEMHDTTGKSFTGYTPSAGTADDWNFKFEWKSGDKGPTITMNGFKYDEWNNETKAMASKWDAENEEWSSSGVQTYPITLPKDWPECTIILTGEDSLLNCMFGITYKCPLTIKSEGNTKLVIDSQASGIAPGGKKGCPLTIDANLDVSIRSYYNTDYSHMLQTYNADLTILGGNINVNTATTSSIFAIFARDGGNVHIKGGKITAVDSVGTGGDNGSICARGGKVIIDGGDVTIKPKNSMGIFAKEGIEINGGKVNILSPYYGMNSNGDIAINGGTVEIIAERAFYKAPAVGSKVNAYAGANRENCEIFDGSDANLAKKPWMLISDTEKIEITEPEEEEVPVFTGVTPTPTTPAGTTPSAPAGNATTAPTVAPTEAPAADSEGGSNNTIIWIAVAAVVVIAGAAVAIILIKRKKA